MNTINGSSEKEIPEPTPPEPTLNEFYVKESNEVIALRDQPEPPPVDGQVTIVDMSKEQLQNAVVNLMNVQNQLEQTLNEYQARAKRIQAIWSDKNEVKKRYFMLRDNPKAKGVKVV